ATLALAGFTAFFLAFAPAAVSKPTAPAPALWRIDGPQGDIYFFGSIHILPKGLQWRRPELDAALAEAQQLVFELDLDQAQDINVMGALVAKLGFLPPDQSLHKMLAPERRHQLDDLATSLGLDPQRMDRMRPWFAAITLSSLSIIKQNTKPGEPLN